MTLKKILSILSLQFVLLAAMSPVTAQDANQAPAPAQTLPREEMLDFMKAQNISPIDVPASVPLRKQYDERWMKWCERKFITPLGERLASRPEHVEKAKEAVRDGFRILREFPDRNYCTPVMRPPAEVATTLAELMDAGADDPLILWMRGFTLFRGTRNFTLARPLLDDALNHKSFRSCGPTFRFITGLNRIFVYREARQTMPGDLYKRSYALALESLADGSYLEGEEDILLENLDPLFSVDVFKGNEKEAKALTEAASLSDRCKTVLRGKLEQGKAWAKTTTWSIVGDPPVGWESFSGNGGSASELYAEAWEKDTTKPEAAVAALSSVVRKDLEKAKAWFSKATSLEFDDMYAWRLMLNAYRYDESSNHDRLLAWGLAAAYTERFDTEVPYLFLDAINKVISLTLGDDPTRQHCKSPLIRKVAVALCQRRVKDATTPQQKKDAMALLAAYAWVCGDYETASKAFTQLPEKFSRSVRLYLTPLGANESEMRGESSLFASGHQETWEKALELESNNDLQPAYELMEGMAQNAQGDGAALLASKLETLKVDMGLTAENWVPLPVKPGLPGWKAPKNDWEGGEDGTLTYRGIGEPSWIFHQGKVGNEFQFRGQYTVTGVTEGHGLGTVVGYEKTDMSEEWITLMHNKHWRGSNIDLLYVSYASSVGTKFTGDSAASGSFLITSRNGRITYELNGREVFRDVHAWRNVPLYKNPLSWGEKAQVGFGHYRFPDGVVIAVTNLEVRRIGADFDPATEKAAEAGPGAEIREEGAIVKAEDITTADDLFDYLEGSIWNFSKEKDGPVGATITIRSRQRALFYYKDQHDKMHHTMSPVDAYTIKIGGDKDLKFYDNYTKFELVHWPNKGESRWGTLKKLPDGRLIAEQLKAGKPREQSYFADTVWTRDDMRLEFKADGSVVHIHPKSTVTGRWFLQSPTEMVGWRQDKGLQHYELSVDGKTLERHADHTVWHLKGDERAAP